jgi:hypothetical protein
VETADLIKAFAAPNLLRTKQNGWPQIDLRNLDVRTIAIGTVVERR